MPAIAVSPTYAVRPVIPRMCNRRDEGTPGVSGTIWNVDAASCAVSVQPCWCSTSDPTGMSATVEATTRPIAPPAIVSPSA